MKKKIFLGNNLLLDEYCIKAIEKKVISKFKNFKEISYQKKVDQYFLDEGKEIMYVFILDESKKDEINKLIKIENNENRKLELELITYGLSYNIDDVNKYCTLYNNTNIYEILNFKVKGIKYSIYPEIIISNNKNEINIIKNDLIDSNLKTIKNEEVDFDLEYEKYINEINKTNKNKEDKELIKKKEEIDILEIQYLRYKNILRDNNLLKFYNYKLNKNNCKFEVKKGCIQPILDLLKEKEKINTKIEEIKNIDKNNDELLEMVKKLENIEKIKFFISSGGVKKIEKSSTLEVENDKYIFYLKVNSKYIEKNKEILDGGEFNIENIKKSIYGVFLTGKKNLNKGTNTQDGFFLISKKVKSALINNVVQENDLYDLLKIEFNGKDICLDTQDFGNKIKEKIKKYADYKIENKIITRLSVYMDLRKNPIKE